MKSSSLARKSIHPSIMSPALVRESKPQCLSNYVCGVAFVESTLKQRSARKTKERASPAFVQSLRSKMIKKMA